LKASRAYAYGPPLAGTRFDSGPEGQRRRERAEGHRDERDEGDRPVGGEGGGQGEDSGADDAADHERGGGGKAERRHGRCPLSASCGSGMAQAPYDQWG
jgi:hypothetical protein